MPTVRRVRPTDLLSLNLCNLDSYTENYDLNFYLTYLMKWPSLFQCVEEEGGKIVAYSPYCSVIHSPLFLPSACGSLETKRKVNWGKERKKEKEKLINCIHSNGQTRNLSTHSTRPQPPSLARPHHHLDRLPTLSPPRLCQTSHFLPRTLLQSILRLVRRPLRPHQQQARHRYVQEYGLLRVQDRGHVLQ